MKLLKMQAISQYVNVYYKDHIIDLKSYFGLATWGLALLTGGFTLPLNAEVRKYDPGVSQSQITLPRETNVNATQNAASEASTATHLPTVTSDTSAASAYVAQLQMLKPKEYKLGTARVFINADDLSPELIDRLKEIHALEDLHSEIYFQDVKPTDLAKLFTDKIKDYPKGLEFNIDLNGILANELHVQGKNVIVYTDAKGKVAQFGLNSDYSFRSAIESIKQGVAQ